MVRNPEHERRLAQDRLLGWSLSCPQQQPGLSLGRDLVLARGPNGLDLARATGMEALVQSLAVALTTRLGDDIFNTGFGFDGLNALAQEPDAILARERIRIAVIQVLRKEPRVRRIVDVKLDGGQLDLATAAGDDPRELNITVAFEAISGEQLNLNLGAISPHV
ncbi:MAG: hypothetical protein JJT90_12255 [Ectothiorhodospiraceae bacterium]|nr:hypothetical protein [Ectothiorhodospiraceae bacterium]